jgi:hypothetical protein
VIIVEMINPRRQFAIRCADIIGMHKCIGAAPPELKLAKTWIPDGRQMESRQ